MNNIGWVKLYRKIYENPIVTKDSHYLSVWIYLLLHATHQPYDVIFKGERITLKPGQLLTGRKSISQKSKISESKVQRILTVFETGQQIEQQTSSQNRLITIINWDLYQNDEQQSEQQVNNNRTTSEQQVNTNKNEKNEKNEKKDIYMLFLDQFNQITGKNYRYSSKNQASLLQRKKEGYEVSDILKATENANKNPFLTGSNPGGKYYLTPEYILRPNKIDEWLNQSEKKNIDYLYNL